MRFTVALAAVALPLTISAYPALERDLGDTLSDVGINVQGLLTSLTPPNPNDPRFTQFQKPGPNDVRSPCPGLNALANHGFIPRNGKDMTLPILIKGLKAGMNMAPDFTIAIGGVGLLSSDSPDTARAFDLNDLDQHNFPIEHDASLSRRDAFFGNDYSFYQPNWDMVLKYYQGKTETDITSASAAQRNRVATSRAINPEVVYGPREFVLANGETALYLQTMADPFSGRAKLDYVRMLFEQEKLPYELGWRPSTVPISLITLGNMVLELSAAAPDPVGDAVTVTADSYKDVFELIAGGSEVLANLTQGLSSAVGL
ncbi:hypothetical protein KC363_g1224 [Hortaea werneckii]|uniref:Heme haloperoxidase family profile domain-containing protein n=1 Tax=Hortaea werneckii TaxID=91943 RepID=A0A3M7FZT5_HORWE|nr:hypothetical protein KC361_g1040 [Hortaea werneckii]KAI7000112.1 hypothetical protein KC359_g1433 [Hortaea werneckii]KAI7149814.1 hypothetical protein KC344_g702 [Hortaea werneckii]KAI7179570.1 hypothetical protein KC360_g809 [Hortaea werneckii]KAI7195924.1 hypothetical protein KC363_g1224 [Hortaea werneckii]